MLSSNFILAYYGTKLIFPIPCMHGNLNKFNRGIYLLDASENLHFRPNLSEDLQQCMPFIVVRCWVFFFHYSCTSIFSVSTKQRNKRFRIIGASTFWLIVSALAMSWLATESWGWRMNSWLPQKSCGSSADAHQSHLRVEYHMSLCWWVDFNTANMIICCGNKISSHNEV